MNGIITEVGGVKYQCVGIVDAEEGDMRLMTEDGCLLPVPPNWIGVSIGTIFRPIPRYYNAGGVAWVETGEVWPPSAQEAHVFRDAVRICEVDMLHAEFPILRPHHILTEEEASDQ